MEVAVDTMARIAGDDVDLALTFDHRVFAGRNRQPRLLDPFAGIGGLGRGTGQVALLLGRLRNFGDRAVVETGVQRIVGRLRHRFLTSRNSGWRLSEAYG